MNAKTVGLTIDMNTILTNVDSVPTGSQRCNHSGFRPWNRVLEKQIDIDNTFRNQNSVSPTNISPNQHFESRNVSKMSKK